MNRFSRTLSRPMRALLLLGIAALLATGCGHSDVSAGDSGGPTVQVAVVRDGPIAQTLALSGRLLALPNREAAVSPTVTGVVDRVYVHFGQTVRRGDPIAQISTATVLGQIRQARATVAQYEVQVQQALANASQQGVQSQTGIAQAQVAVAAARSTLAGAEATLRANQAALGNARKTLARIRDLHQAGVSSTQDLEAARLAEQNAAAQVAAQQAVVASQRDTLDSQRQALLAARAATLQTRVKRQDVKVVQQQAAGARGALATAQAQLALYTLRAPIDGQVTAVAVNVGETADPSKSVATISNLDTLQLELAVPVEDVPGVQPGQTVSFSDAAGRVFHATVATVGQKADAAASTVTALAPVPNPGHRLQDNTVVSARLVTRRKAHALLAPQDAVLVTGAEKHVVVVGSDEVAHLVAVKTGLAQDGQVEIVRGLRAGERVVVKGAYGLPDGTHVKVAPAVAG